MDGLLAGADCCLDRFAGCAAPLPACRVATLECSWSCFSAATCASIDCRSFSCASRFFFVKGFWNVGGIVNLCSLHLSFAAHAPALLMFIMLLMFMWFAHQAQQASKVCFVANASSRLCQLCKLPDVAMPSRCPGKKADLELLYCMSVMAHASAHGQGKTHVHDCCACSACLHIHQDQLL